MMNSKVLNETATVEPSTEGALDTQGVAKVAARTQQLFTEHCQRVCRNADRLFVLLLILEWLAGVVVALTVSPRAWRGLSSQPHIHLYVAGFLGLFIIGLPVFFALTRPATTVTRHVIAIGQSLMSALIIHLSGGRIEAHFLVFGSLSFLAFYRDWRVLVTASIVVALDHFLRGVYFPQSVYGTPIVEPLRWLEHAAWVGFADLFLSYSCLLGRREMMGIAHRQAQLESTNEIIEHKVVMRTREVEEYARRAQETRRQVALMEQREDFMATLTHDLKNPIIGANRILELFLDGKLGALEDSQLKIILQLRDSNKNLLEMLKNLIDVYRYEKEANELKFELITALPQVEQCLESMSALAAARRIEIEVVVEGNPLIQADPHSLRRVMQNLIDNAIKFAPDGGRVTVTLKEESAGEKKRARVDVHNTGSFITEDDRKRLFQRFWQGTEGKRYVPGTGLGLYVCRQITDAHGGIISCRSDTSGTTFSVILPAVIAPR